jgi:hypothetical protein
VTESEKVARELIARHGWKGANNHVGVIIRRLRRRGQPMESPNVKRWHDVLVELEKIWISEEWR